MLCLQSNAIYTRSNDIANARVCVVLFWVMLGPQCPIASHSLAALGSQNFPSTGGGARTTRVVCRCCVPSPLTPGLYHAEFIPLTLINSSHKQGALRGLIYSLWHALVTAKPEGENTSSPTLPDKHFAFDEGQFIMALG